MPGHARRKPRRTADRTQWACACACGWQGHGHRYTEDAVAEHTAHKDAVRSGEWARLFEADRVAEVTRRAEPHGLIDEVNARIESRARGLIHLFDYRKK